ncbi:MAG: cation diffusion facilitator family transporter [Gammaproteobacteria bacterium]|nr:cation diffusion facilitator family transporter [Gammaproteobacteria bacterium]
MKDNDRACCCDINVTSSKEKRVLIIALILNAGMFIAEFGAGILSHSTALLADSLDMLADAFVYAISLFALGRAQLWRNRAALTNGGLELIIGIGILIEAISKLFIDVIPQADVMGVFGVAALLVNTVCFVMLRQFRQGDINLRAVWICSRNDMLANIGVLVAAGLVALTQKAWPDIVIGAIIASIIVHSAWKIIQESFRHIK